MLALILLFHSSDIVGHLTYLRYPLRLDSLAPLAATKDISTKSLSRFRRTTLVLARCRPEWPRSRRRDQAPTRFARGAAAHEEALQGRKSPFTSAAQLSQQSGSENSHQPAWRRDRIMTRSNRSVSLNGSVSSRSGRELSHIPCPGSATVGEFDLRACQQLERPARTALWGTGTGGRHQQGFFLAGEFALRSGARLFAQRPLQIAFHEASLGPISRSSRLRQRSLRPPRRWSRHRRPAKSALA